MIRVACIGDSITWGFTLLNPWKQSYPVLLQEKLGDSYEVRNFGHNDASARFDADTPYVKKRVYRESLAWNPTSSGGTTGRSSSPIRTFLPTRALS